MGTTRKLNTNQFKGKANPRLTGQFKNKRDLPHYLNTLIFYRNPITLHYTTSSFFLHNRITIHLLPYPLLPYSPFSSWSIACSSWFLRRRRPPSPRGGLQLLILLIIARSSRNTLLKISNPHYQDKCETRNWILVCKSGAQNTYQQLPPYSKLIPTLKHAKVCNCIDWLIFFDFYYWIVNYWLILWEELLKISN